MKLLRDKVFAAVALGHLTVDLLNGQRAILLAFLSVPLGLTNTTLGIVSTVYQLVSALAQPLFGYLSDRLGARWVIAGGVLWMGVFFALGLIVPGSLALVFLILASAGSGAFHPAGATQATLRGRDLLAGREATAASSFFVFGQLGFFFGPLLGGPLLEKWGAVALLGLVVITLPMGLLSADALKGIRPMPSETASSSVNPTVPRGKQAVIILVTLGFIAMFQSMAQQVVNTFVPKMMVDLGQSASTYGLLAAFFMGSSAMGNLMGGILADRFGRKQVVGLAMSLGAIPLFFISQVDAHAWYILLGLVIAAGLLNGAAYSVIVVMA
ncbi:MAG TPA: MFS transporter, partial [Anaerolineaceae bacterium]|nr:MFS transporter [Anaerolineaceae bacterium]